MQLELTLLPGARELLALHARELPQRDDLCGAFCGALALRAAGIEQWTLRARSIRTPSRWPPAASSRRSPTPARCRAGETGRRDYRLSLPFVAEAALVGHDGERAARRDRGALRAGGSRRSPTAARGRPRALGGLFDLVAGLERPATLRGQPRHPPPVGLARRCRAAARLPARRPAGRPRARLGRRALRLPDRPRARARAAASTASPTPTPRWGARGVHLQPQERLAAAVERRDMPAGGIIAIVSAQEAPAVRAGAAALGLREGSWDNGTATARGARGERRPSSSRSSAAISARSCGDARCSRPSSARGSTPASAGCPPTRRSRRSARSPSPTRSARPATCACCPTPPPSVRVEAENPDERPSAHALRHHRDRRRALGVLPAAIPARGAGRARGGARPARCSASFEHEFQLLHRGAARRCRSRSRRSAARNRSPRI